MQADTWSHSCVSRHHRTHTFLKAGVWAFCLAWLLLVFGSQAQAQYRASLQGTITDTSGAVVPGAKITLTSNETNREWHVTSNDAGDFAINALPPSLYRMVVEKDGFKSKQLDTIKILSEQANSLNVQLEIGNATETVTVNAAERPLIDTETGQVGGSINQQQIANMPAYGRDVFQLVQLAPGVFGDGSQGSGGGSNGLPGNQGPGGSGQSSGVFQTENRPQASGNGGRTDQNNITLDGVSINSVTWQGAAVITPSADSIKELKVVANSYDAQWGRSSGAQIQAISQNGTNNFHGTAFFKVDRPGLNAFQRWSPDNNPQRNTSRFNQYGGTVGGPILKDRIFAFFSYETIRNSSTATAGGWYDTSAYDQSAPANSIASKYLTYPGAAVSASKLLEGAGDRHTCADVGLVQGVTCNFIPGQGLDLGRPLTGTALGTKDPSWQSNTQPGLGGDGTGSPANFDGVADLAFAATVSPNKQTSQQFSGRLDFQVTQNDLVAYSIYWVPQDNSSYNGPARAYNFFNHNQLNHAQTALWNHTFSPTLLNEARVDFAGWKWNELTSNPQTPYGLPVSKIQTENGAQSLGTISTDSSAQGLQQFGPNVGSVFNQWTASARDTVTKVVNSHNLKFGGEVLKLAYLDEATWNAQPTYSFRNMWDFLNDAPVGESATADPRTGIPSYFRKDDRNNLYNVFVQDDWKIKSNLTINLGLRWEYFGPLYEKSGNQATLLLGQGADIFTGARIKLGGDQFKGQKANFGPQFGFAWSPERFNSRLVMRGGFGMGYSGLEAAITTNTRFNPPFAANSGTLTGSQIVYGTAADLKTFGALPANPALTTTFNSANLPAANGVSLGVTGLQYDFPTAYSYRFSLEGQYDLGRHWVATVGYQGSLGRHLPLQTYLNTVYASQAIAGTVAYNPKLNSIDWYEDTGSSNFNALRLEAHHQFSQNFELDAQYRWSKSLDNGSGPYTTPDYMYAQGYNYGPSDFDVRHMGKVWALWSPRIFSGNHGWLEKVVGGWTFSTIVNYHTGFPWNPKYNGIGCSASIPNSNNCDLRAATYLGGAGTSQSTDTFKKATGNFPNVGPGGGADGTYFLQPSVTSYNGGWPSDGTAPVPVALPGAPGIGRNAFFGPRYFDTDATGTKAFGLPKLPVLGENARFEIRANAYNLFNQLNLFNPRTNIRDSHFGQAGTVLGSRTIELEGHFKF